MFPFPMKVGTTVTSKRTYEVKGFEAVTVPAGRYENVAKVETTEQSDGGRSTVWLAPWVGVVRWERTSGRIDELVGVEGLPAR